MASTSIYELRERIIDVANTTTNFKTQLVNLQRTLILMQYVGEGTVSGDASMALLVEAEKLVRECPEIKSWNLFNKFRHARKLDDVNYKLFKIRSTQPAQKSEWSTLLPKIRSTSGSAPESSTLLPKIRSTSGRAPESSTLLPEIRSTSASAPESSSSASERNTAERGKLGWLVTRLPRGTLTFDEPLKKLKAKVLVAGDVDSSVVVVSGAAGCGKTVLVNILCNDHQVEAKYGENIFYVTVPEKPDFMVMVDDLLHPKHFGKPIFQSNKQAHLMLQKFLIKQVARGPVLLVLDGVQTDLFIKNFEFKIKGYKILATSKMIFPKYDVFQLDPLSDEDAMALFKLSAFGTITRNYSSTIDDDLVNQMVKCCKKHPLTLSVVGGSLNGKSEFVWKSVIKILSQGEWVIDDKDVRKCLERTIEQLDDEFKNCLLAFDNLDGEELKQCLLDLGLFPRNHIIPACALLDLWTYLYDHDDTGRDTLIKIFQLADRNFVSSITIGEEANAVVNYCEQTFATQQDWQRELAIHVSSKEPISERTRLIIDAQGHDLPASIRQLKDVKARILSITTGESFSSRWCNMNAPEVEIMVLNIMSETYILPQFLETMHRLKVLNVTNYGLHPTKFVNVHLFGSLSSLTRISLKRVVLSLLSTSILALVNLQKLSFIMCKTDNSFEKLNSGNRSVWPRLVEIEIDDCQDLVGFPDIFCNTVNLKKLSITNCNEMIQICEALGKLTSLETLSLRSCIKLEKLPDSIIRLKKLSVLDISDCVSLSNLPANIGELGGLQMIYMKGCTGIHELPPSVKDLSQPQVLCNEEISYKWREFPNVKIPVVEEDRLFNLTEN